MSKTIYKKWKPIDGIDDTLYLEGLHDDYEGFRLLLKGSSKQSGMLKISFDPSLVYRNIDEGDYLKILKESQGLAKWSLYKAEKSSFIDWFVEQNYAIHNRENIIQYSIYTPNDCVDILSEYPPKVEWLN